MKTTQFYLAICFALFAASVDVKAQQQLLNGGFEFLIYPEDNPEHFYPDNWTFGWDGTNCYESLGKPTTESYSGNWAVKLESRICVFSLKERVYTFLQVPDFEIAVPGHAINHRPDQIKFYHKYEPVGGDTALVSILLFNLPDSLPSTYLPFHHIDTVGYTEKLIIEESSDYSQVLIDLEYQNADTASYIMVLFASNYHSPFSNALISGHPGTTLWIDDVELIYINTSVGEWSDSDFNIFPNPVTDRFQLNQAGDVKAKRMVLLNHVGQYVGELNPLDHFHAVDHLPPGMYFLQIETEQGVVVKKMVKE